MNISVFLTVNINMDVLGFNLKFLCVDVGPFHFSKALLIYDQYFLIIKKKLLHL